MSRRLVTTGLVASLFLLGTFATGSAQTLELKLTGCLTKKGKLKRVEIGTEPAKPCKDNQELIMIPLNAKTDLLMDADVALAAKDDQLMTKDGQQDVAIADNATNIGQNSAAIGALQADEVIQEGRIDALEAKDMELMEKNAEQDGRIDDLEAKDMVLMEKNAEQDGRIDALEVKDMALMEKNAEQDAAIGENSDMIKEIKEELVSSMWGGGSRKNADDGPVEFYMPIFDMLYCEDRNVCESKVAVSGKLTKLVAYQTEPSGNGETIHYTLVVNGEEGETPLHCDIAGDTAVMCESDVDACVNVEMGDLVAVRGLSDSAVRPVRWTARFVEGGSCPPPPPTFCNTFQCPDGSSIDSCNNELEKVTCKGEGATCFAGVETCGPDVEVFACDDFLTPPEFMCQFTPEVPEP